MPRSLAFTSYQSKHAVVLWQCTSSCPRISFLCSIFEFQYPILSVERYYLAFILLLSCYASKRRGSGGYQASKGRIETFRPARLRLAAASSKYWMSICPYVLYICCARPLEHLQLHYLLEILPRSFPVSTTSVINSCVFLR